MTPDYLSTVQSAYVACALWSSTDDNGEPLDESGLDLAPETLDAMYEDCADFCQLVEREGFNLDTLGAMGCNASQMGHDFWLTRNGHGAGFWDRGYPDNIGERLTALAKPYSTRELYIGDDDQVYQV